MIGEEATHTPSEDIDGAGETTRTATVNRDGDEEPLGVTLYFSADQLRELGTDISDAIEVRYTVIDGELALETRQR